MSNTYVSNDWRVDLTRTDQTQHQTKAIIAITSTSSEIAHHSLSTKNSTLVFKTDSSTLTNMCKQFDEIDALIHRATTSQ